jgi:acyl carrier protein
VADDEVYERFRQVALDITDAPPELVTPDARLGETLGMDSVHLIEIAGVLENAYGVSLEDHELYDLVTVQDYVDLVTAKRTAGG